MDHLNQNIIRGPARSTNAGTATKSMTAQQQNTQHVSFEALLSAVVQDAANSVILRSQIQSPASGQLAMSSPGASLTPGSVATPNSSHTRTPSLQVQLLQHQKHQYQHQRLQRQQEQEFLQHSRNLLQAQYRQSFSAPVSPLSQTSPTFANSDQAMSSGSRATSRQPRTVTPKETSQLVPGSASESSFMPNFSACESTSRLPSTYGSQSDASSVLQTPLPLVPATMSDTPPAVHAENGNDSAGSSTDTALCPARKVTQSDCHDHAHVRGQPVLHVCHWQNCHASFTTVQSLLQHISKSHLGLNMCVDVGSEAAPITDPASHIDQLKMDDNAGTTAQAFSFDPEQNSIFGTSDRLSGEMSGNGVSALAGVVSSHSALGLGGIMNTQSSEATDKMTAPTALKSPLMPSRSDFTAFQQYPIPPTQSNLSSDLDNFANSLGIIGSHDASQSAVQSAMQSAAQAGLAATVNGGPMACLWDDCPPFDPFAHFGQQCLDEACGIPPTNDTHALGLSGTTSDQAIDTTMLTCDPSCSQDHAHLFPCEPSCTQEHAHIYPMHLHSYSSAHPSHPHNVQLDSATAVLKHLLQQHLGVDLTQGLLNAASQQLGDVTPAHASRTSGHGWTQNMPHPRTSSTSTAPVSRRPSTEKQALAGSLRKPKPLKAPPRKATEDKPIEMQTHVCRWHGCTDKFDCVEDLTEHLSDVHIGKGKTDYQCLWAGCEVCEEGQEVGANRKTPKGRKFTTRQKVMRHMQVSVAGIAS